MILKILSVGELDTNCYILGDEQTKEGAVIDPGGDFDLIAENIEKLNLKIRYIILTHGHVDHVQALTLLKEKTKAKVLIHSEDASILNDPMFNLSQFTGGEGSFADPDLLLKDGDTVEFGKIKLDVIHTPGHTPGSISLYTDNVLFTGDTLFCEGVGRTDLPGASWEKLLNSIKQKLFIKPDVTEVLPGHGPSTTIGWEKENNPWIN
ncbi:MAG: MBL fold metallo-hydrolase [candidate division Zixibacteria bacterium SM23_73_2]|nr:MAG: MBL fold metallo-hydrolase [candidate division Zixibacteria bacterium SM23_73_2]